MTGDRNLTDRTELLRQAYLKIEKLQERLRMAEKGRSEPIAVIGIGCRFPGDANDPQSFWKLLEGGVDAVGEIPSDRWDVDAYYSSNPDAEGKMCTRNGAFLSQIDGFDAQFFGISPREAIKMDPQQRVLLEVVWEALEHAGQAPERLAGSATGVFIGMNADDYAHLHSRWAGLESADLYYGSGVARSIAAGRISYVLGLRGPSMAIDTACSSSLVAVHLACQSLRDGESRMAVAGGVTLIIAPDGHVLTSRGRMLSRDGRCKTFDASADGYGRGEGCGIVVLKRLSDARVDGDRILAQIRASAVNQDGRSGGMTAPNGIAQEAVMRKALAQAGIKPEAVRYIETHGTGTVLGDPIEVQALGAVYGMGRSREDSLLIGSVKTNVGHLEAAAGVAGLIKTVLAVNKGEIPPHLHFKEPNPHIAWDELPIEVATRVTPWPGDPGRRIAGVSSFGFSGTNAHVIVENDAEPVPPRCPDQRSAHLLVLSAKTPSALDQLADRYISHFKSHPFEEIGDICYSAATGRSHFNCRLGVIGRMMDDLKGELEDFRQGRESAAAFRGDATPGNAAPTAFLFTGQGSQYVGMGQRLYETQPTFRKTLERCDEILRAELDRPLLSVLYPEPGKAEEAQQLLDQTGYAQPALFALEYALADLWRSWGIEPSAVMGHGVGEYVAACVAGVFGLEDGLRLIAARGRLMQSLPHKGAMAALFTDEQTALAAIEVHAGVVSLAALNGPANTVISGEAPAVMAICEVLRQRGIGSVPLNVSHAFYSPLMEPMLDAFEGIAASVHYNKPHMDLLSNVTGKQVEDNEIDAGYWRKHARSPVRFMQSIRSLHALGCRWFIEAGPHPVLCDMAGLIDQLPDALWLPSLHKGSDGWARLLESLGRLYVSGAHVDWRGFGRNFRRTKIPLPTYPFQRKRYWAALAKGRGADGGRPENAVPDRSAGAAPALQEAGDLLHWYYGVEWRPVDSIPDPGSHSAQGAWLILADRGGVAGRLRERLEALGAICATAVPGSAFRNLPQRCWEIVPERPEDFRHLIEETETSLRSPLRGIVYLWGLDLEAPARGCQDQALACGGVLNLIKELSSSLRMLSERLWLVTSGAQAVDGRNNCLAVQQATLWGMGRVIALEMPRLWGGLIDLAPDDPLEQTELLAREILAGGKEDQIAFRSSRRFVARLTALQPSPTAERVPGLKPDGTYLITGGLGGLGFSVARWMVEQGVRYLVLTGRNRPSESAGEVIAQWARSGVRVEFVRADVADLGQIESSIDPMLNELPPLKGIVHAAGVIDDGVLLNQDWQRFAAVMAPKVQGAWNLHLLSQRHPLDFFVLFSSIAAVLGSSGQANYAAGNAFLDALAHFRRAKGMPAVSINWGPWSQVGMAASLQRKESLRREALGIGLIPPHQGLAILETILASEAAQICVLPVEWNKLLEQYPSGDEPSLLHAVALEQRPVSKPAGESEARLLGFLDAGSPQEREDQLCSYIRHQVIRILNLDPDQLPDLHQNLGDMGMDSLMAVELNQRLQADLGRPLPSTLAFEYPTIHALVRFIADEVLELRKGEESAEAAPAAVHAKRSIDAELEQMSDEEAELELLKALESKGY